MTATTGRTTAKTMAGTEITNNNQDMNRETKTTQTGMTIIKIEIGMTTTKTDTGLTTEGDQTNYNTHSVKPIGQITTSRVSRKGL